MIPKVIFNTEKVPVLQNRVFPTYKQAIESATGDVVLVQDGDRACIQSGF